MNHINIIAIERNLYIYKLYVLLKGLSLSQTTKCASTLQFKMQKLLTVYVHTTIYIAKNYISFELLNIEDLFVMFVNVFSYIIITITINK